MLNKQFVCSVFIILVLGWSACKEKEYGGEDILNYPDLNQVLVDSWDTNMPYVYLKVSQTNKQVDTVRVQSTSMPWDEIRSLFAKASINKPELNHHYSIDIMKDSILNTKTIYYKSLASEDYTRTLNIISSGDDNKLTSVYIETADHDEISKILYIPESLIQIQKKPKEGEKKQVKVETYYFPD